MCFISLRRWIKRRDVFGRPIGLHFKEEGDKINTVTGGILSLTVHVLIIYILWYKLNAMNLK